CRRLSGIIRETFFHRVVGLDNSILFGDVCQVPFSTRFSACLSPLEAIALLRLEILVVKSKFGKVSKSS
ncbi:MAG: hypothetical protein AAGA60_23935, partial [Cyanobacteria bacterium P01_E01_bin.42]